MSEFSLGKPLKINFSGNLMSVFWQGCIRKVLFFNTYTLHLPLDVVTYLESSSVVGVYIHCPVYVISIFMWCFWTYILIWHTSQLVLVRGLWNILTILGMILTSVPLLLPFPSSPIPLTTLNP